MLEVSGDIPAVGGGLGLYRGVAGNPGGDLCLDLAATKALAASERRRYEGDSTGDLNPPSSFCSKVSVGVEHSEILDFGVEAPDDDDRDDLGEVGTSDEPRSKAVDLAPAIQWLSKF